MRRVNSTASMSGEIEQVVTKLLRTTKALLEALTQWSLMRTSNNEIYEIHNTLETQFFLVSQAFEDANVTMGDLQWIPRQLRESVSTAMSEPPSPAVLDQHLPRIREVIVHLLQGLKGKQALLREKERESRASIRSNSTTESWNREVPLAALNRGNNSSRMMMYPPSSPPLPPHPPLSPRSEYEPWSGGMPRPNIPTNDLSSRIMPRANYSPPQTSPRLQHQQTSPRLQNQQIPVRSNSYRVSQSVPPPPPPPPPPVVEQPPPPPQPPQSFDESDPNTASALAALKRQENLARRSSVRRASMFRAGGEYTGGSISRAKGQNMFNNDQVVPPVPTLPLKNVDYTVGSPVPSKLNTVTESNEVHREEEEEEENTALTLFLQIGKQVQKVEYNGEISISALNMLFLEKFSYSLGQNDFPKIYIRDPTVGVSYELTDMSEVRNKSVLSFNIDEKEEQKETQKEWISEVTSTFNKELNETRRLFMEQIEEIKKQINESNEKTISLNKEREASIIEQLSAHISTQQATPAPAAPVKEEEQDKETETQVVTPSVSKEQFDAQRLEIETLRRDIAVLRQLEREMRDETAKVISEIKQKAETAKQQESQKSETQIAVARSSLEDGKKSLIEKSEKITNRLEELQDTIDQLKLDVTQRKCRPSEAQMTHCAKERQGLAEEIEEFGKFITQVKPRWKKTWEHELQTIVKEQQTLKDQEYLLSDMKDDLDALLEVYEQLEKICAYQASARPQVREFRVAPAEEGFEGMSSVLKQVSSIDVDHDRRVRAMEQAEKMRQRELANRIDDFEKELVGFVENKKLKKTGGADEIERIRKQKDEEIRKALFAEKSGASTPTTITEDA